MKIGILNKYSTNNQGHHSEYRLLREDTNLFSNENHNKLSLKDLFKKDLIFRQKKSDFDNEKVLPKDPNSDDIRNAVIEMDDHIINAKPYSTFENDLNDRFWKIFSEYYEKDPKNKKEIEIRGRYNVLSRFDINFLKKNYKWFLD